MRSLQNKVVMITGASSGIGEACARQFASLGANLVMGARREDRLLALAEALREEYGVAVYPVQMDVRHREEVEAAWQSLPESGRQVDVLINNAGLALALESIQDGDAQLWEQMIDTNIKGVLTVTRTVLKGMVARQRGHIINIGSISSYQVYPGGAVYCATKFAINAITEGIKMDTHGSGIRVSQVSPGMVETEFSTVRFAGDQQKADRVYQGMTPLRADDIADAIVYCATRPQHVDVREIKIYPTAQTASHMVDRK